MLLSMVFYLCSMIFAEILLLFVKVLLHLGDLLFKVHLYRRRLLFLLLFNFLLLYGLWLRHSRYLWSSGSLNRILLLGWLAICLHFRKAAGSLSVHPVEMCGRGATLTMDYFFGVFVRSIWSVTERFDWISLKVVFSSYHLDVEYVHIAFVVEVWVSDWTLAHRLIIILKILKFGGIFFTGLLRLEMPYHHIILRQIINLHLNLLLTVLKLLQFLRETYRARLQGCIMLVDFRHFLRDWKDFFINVNQQGLY